jgi:hypothetical protein
MSARTDSEGYSTKVTALGKGFGVRVLRNGAVVAEDSVATKADIGPRLKELLRMLDKCGNPSSMASASRDRNF